MRRSPYVAVGAVGVVSAATAAGVTYALVHHQGRAAHPAPAPIVLTGSVRDSKGHPVANATLRLSASDDGNAKVGQTIPVVALASSRTDALGRFTFRQSKSVPIIRKLASENDGWVNFDVMISAQAGFMPWAVPRRIGPNGWVTEDDRPAALERELITFTTR